MTTQLIFSIALIVYLCVISYRWIVFAFMFDTTVQDDLFMLTLIWWSLLILYSTIY